MIVYGSEYGSAKWYAQTLGKKMNMEAVDVRQFKGGEDPVIFISSLYAGGFKGARQFLKTMNKMDQKRFVLVSCGLADPKEEHVQKEIVSHAHAVFDPLDFEWFGVRGGIDYSRLSWKHRTMMKMMKTMIEKKGMEENSKEFLSTYGKKVSFCDEAWLDDVIEYLNIHEKETVPG